MKRQAFSLVEISIVLVILGLLVGGIMGGQALIRASELRAVTTESQRFLTAFTAFEEKYFALPGDMNNATSYFGTSTACSGASATGSCNGNGDNVINTAAAANGTGEIFQLWRQLNLGGFIDGSFSGTAGSGSSIHSVPGTNVPESKLTNAGWSFYPLFNYAGDTGTYAANYGNQMLFGAPGGNSVTETSILKPEEAWNIDLKVDDGMPGRGRVFARENGGFGNATTCTTSTNNTDYAGTYKVTISSPICALKFLKAL